MLLPEVAGGTGVAADDLNRFKSCSAYSSLKGRSRPTRTSHEDPRDSGVWRHCLNCGRAGDLIELAVAVWGMRLLAALDKPAFRGRQARRVRGVENPAGRELFLSYPPLADPAAAGRGAAGGPGLNK